MSIEIVEIELENRFNYHQPNTQEKIDRHTRVREACLDVAKEIVEVTSPTREQSLAITKLEEAMFWANAAIAREKSNSTPR